MYVYNHTMLSLILHNNILYKMTTIVCTFYNVNSCVYQNDIEYIEHT